MKIALFGGSFDPVHVGHTEPVREAVRRLGLDRVIYLPTADPPLKEPRSALAHRRFAMVELALLAEPELRVSAFELTPGRTAYTVESVRHFEDRHPEDELFLLLGTDAFLQLPLWRDWQEIVERATVVVMARPGWRAQRQPEPLRRAVDTEKVLFVENPPVPVASRELRSRLEAGEPPPEGSICPLVLDYIRKYGLYR